MIIWLIGPSGAGKTTVGRRLAERRGATFVDVDDEIERRSGEEIGGIFASVGESGFRRLEWEAVQDAAHRGRDGALVVALGAGAIVYASVRRLIRATGTRIYLDVPAETALVRLLHDRRRPLLDTDDPRASWQGLLDERLPHYRDTDIAVDAAPAVDDVVAAIGEQLAHRASGLWSIDMTIDGEPTTTRSSPTIAETVALLRSLTRSRRAAVVIDATVASEYGDAFNAIGTIIPVQPGESAKSFAAAEELVHAFASAELGRDDVVVAIGGGVVTDLAGFAASIYMRGVEAIYVPTTLLAMVDAAIGGKTAIDAAGVRNLVGTIRQPRHVVICTSLLRTLSPRELRSGFVESLKMGIANSEQLAHAVDAVASEIPAGGIPDGLDEVIRLSVATKLDVVRRDARDDGARLSLNFGHTFGHALEAVEPHRHTHGEAVAFGILAATHAAFELGVISSSRRDELLEMLSPFARPVGDGHDVRAIVAAMFTDKKRTGRGLRLVLPIERTGVTVHETTDGDLLIRAIQSAVASITALVPA